MDWSGDGEVQSWGGRENPTDVPKQGGREALNGPPSAVVSPPTLVPFLSERPL